jgi:hypothetical protein
VELTVQDLSICGVAFVMFGQSETILQTLLWIPLAQVPQPWQDHSSLWQVELEEFWQD